MNSSELVTVALKEQILSISKAVARRLKEADKQVALKPGASEYSYRVEVDGEPFVLSFVGPTVIMTDADGCIRGAKFAWGAVDSTAICVADAFLTGKKRASVLGDEPMGQLEKEGLCSPKRKVAGE